MIYFWQIALTLASPDSHSNKVAKQSPSKQKCCSAQGNQTNNCFENLAQTIGFAWSGRLCGGIGAPGQALNLANNSALR